ncbi:MAG TPA: hypothetical protein VFH10_14450 [Nocardioides sp.]|uniref:hypothetical protein n=1 Tax=Nocardioides sp. TaxID=35761 RepID=UPI002D8115F3|nr:hypothetical protein [Nocardioides sp.]HET6653840.1 hypothetical protein [Nocardioides sp.]
MTNAPGSMGSTRRSLHGVAELVLAGPQYQRSGTIRLQATPGGFGTTRLPELSVRGDRLVGPDGDVGLHGRTAAQVAAAVGVAPHTPAGLYADGSGVSPDEPLSVDAETAAFLGDVFAVGNEALLAFVPQETPVLWPEHFDIAVSVDEVNYGVSPGDGWSSTPYAYVGPWSLPAGGFWDAPFGAARPVTEETTVEQLVSFFREGRDAAQAQASASS